MELSEAKVFVKAVVTHRHSIAANEEPIPEVPAPDPKLQKDLQPEPENQPTAQSTSPSADVAGSKSESGNAERQHVDTKADRTAADVVKDVKTNAKSTRTDVRGGTVVRRGVLSSGFRLVPMSDEELRRKRGFAGESVVKNLA